MPARKLLTGLAHVFRWSNADGLLASNPTLTVDWPAGPQAYSLTLSRQFDVVTAISADRRTLTATWGGSGSPQMAISGDQPAPVVLQSIGLVGAALRVVRVVTDDGTEGTLELAEPVPHPVTMGQANLHWLQRQCIIPSIDQPATPTRNIRWTIDYEALDSFSIEPLQYVRDRDVLHVVAMEFATGLSDGDLLGYVPDLRARPQGQGSWKLQRDAALDELVGLIKRRIAPRHEDVLPGRQFARTHAYLAAAVILDGTSVGGQDRTALATYYRERAAAELDNVLSLIDWQDLNLDGDVQQNEVDVAASQQLARQVGSTLTDPAVVLFAEDNAPYPLDRARVTDQR
jgi:hypothetical protein